MFLCCQVGSLPALPLGMALLFTHAVGMSACIQNSSSERSQIFLLAEKSPDPTLRAVMNQHTSFGPGARADSWHRRLTRTELATDHQGFCARPGHNSITEDVKNLVQLCCSRSAEVMGSLFSCQHKSCGSCSAGTCSPAFWEKASSSG